MAISRRTCLLLALVFVSVFAGWQGIGASYAVSAGPSPASGASARLDSNLEELTIGADSVVVGTVVERNSYWNDEHTRIYTSMVLSLDDIFKGKISQDRITVSLLGGEADGIGEWVSDMPSFDQGEKAVVFLKKLSREQIPHTTVSQEQLSEEQFEVYGGFRGKFTVTGDKVGNLRIAQFKGHVNKILNGQTLTDDELDVPLSPIISPYSYSGYCWPHPPARLSITGLTRTPPIVLMKERRCGLPRQPGAPPVLTFHLAMPEQLRLQLSPKISSMKSCGQT